MSRGLRPRGRLIPAGVLCLRSGEVSERSKGAACRRLLEVAWASPARPSNPGRGTLPPFGEVSERSKERDWKSRTG